MDSGFLGAALQSGGADSHAHPPRLSFYTLSVGFVSLFDFC